MEIFNIPVQKYNGPTGLKRYTTSLVMLILICVMVLSLSNNKKEETSTTVIDGVLLMCEYNYEHYRDNSQHKVAHTQMNEKIT